MDGRRTFIIAMTEFILGKSILTIEDFAVIVMSLVGVR